MRRTLLAMLALLAVGCGGDGANGDDGSVTLFFSNEEDFSPSSIGLTSFDTLEGSRDDGLNVYIESGPRTLEIDLPSGRTTDLEDDLQASVFYDGIFGEAEGVAGTVTVLSSADDRIWLRLDDVVLADEDGTGEATLSGTIMVENVLASRGRKAHVRSRASYGKIERRKPSTKDSSGSAPSQKMGDIVRS